MADNVTMPLTGSGDATALIAADEIAGAKHQRVKLTLGADGVNDGDVSSANPVPVTAASLPLPAGAATSAKQDTAQTSLSSIDTKTPALGQALAAASVPVVLTASQLSTLTPVAGGATLAEQQTQTASLSVMDDWDETDRAKVNIIAGQAGVQGGAGAVSANTQRMVLATDQTVIPVSDNGGSLTVDAPVGTPVFVRLSDGSSAIATLPVSLASVPSHAVTNAGTFAVQDSEKVADNAGFTDGTTKVQPAGYIYDEVAGTALSENDAAAARINVNRAQVAAIEDGATRGRYATITASNALKTDGSAVTQPVSAASLPLPAGAATSALQTQPGVDIGDVTVNNAAGASSVNIQDGGNSITVDGSVTANPTDYLIRLDEASATITYVGKASPGTATSAASWSIKRLDSASGLIVLWGAGTPAFNQIWDNRAGLAYS